MKSINTKTKVVTVNNNKLLFFGTKSILNVEIIKKIKKTLTYLNLQSMVNLIGYRFFPLSVQLKNDK